MCGIAGIAFADARRTPARAMLERMIGTLRHRGPDGFGFHTSPGIGLAHARLSIIDLAGGSQPIRNETGSIWVVLNGEIFNYIELRERLEAAGHKFYTQSDTEVIVHAYEEFGMEFVAELNGQFAIALWDDEIRQLVLVRDRIGIRPVLYAQTSEGIAFASEAKSLFAAPWIRPELDPVGLAEVATFWSCNAPRTSFAGVQSLPPGHMAVFRDGRLTVTQYWSWQFDEDGFAGRAIDDVVDELRALFLDCVRLQLRSDVPVGAYLSGGLDSSAVTAAVKNCSDGGPLTTFSLAFADAEFDERQFQRDVAEHLHTEHVSLQVDAADIGDATRRAIWHFETPVVRTAGIPLMLLADQVRRAGIKVVLTGEGADEVFGGYDIFKEAKIRRFWAQQPDSAYRPLLFKKLYGYLANSPTSKGSLGGKFFGQSLGAIDDPFFAHRPRWSLAARALRILSPGFRERIDAQHPIARLDEFVLKPSTAWSPLARDQFVEATTLLPGYLLHAQGDRVAMAASIEARYPFLDHRLVEFANRLPARWKIRGLTEKYILRRAVNSWLPSHIAKRTKQPYRAPECASFFRDGRPLDWVGDALASSRVRDAGYFDPQMVARLMEKCRTGAAIGFADNMAFVLVLTTQLLHDEFVLRNWDIGDRDAA